MNCTVERNGYSFSSRDPLQHHATKLDIGHAQRVMFALQPPHETERLRLDRLEHPTQQGPTEAPSNRVTENDSSQRAAP